MTHQEHLAAIRGRAESSLAAIVGCKPEHLPPAVSKTHATVFLGLTNEKTLDVWKSTQRYPLTFIKVGRNNKVGTDSLIDLIVDSAEIPASAA